MEIFSKVLIFNITRLKFNEKQKSYLNIIHWLVEIFLM